MYNNQNQAVKYSSYETDPDSGINKKATGWVISDIV